MAAAVLSLGAATHPNTSQALERNADIAGDPCVLRFSAKQTRPFVERVWPLIRWERGKPRPIVIRIYHRRLQCAAGPGHRKAIRKRWHKSKLAFYRYRKEQLANWCSPTPHPEGEGCWEIPAWCVRNESGESWTAHNPTSPARGPYQELGHGGPWPVTSRAEAMEHHQIAEGLYAVGGLGPWVAC